MSIYKKKIVTPKVYNANTPFKGGKESVPITKDRILSMAATGNAMLEAGLKISAPFAHKDEDGIVPKPLRDGEKGSWNSAINGGYWNKFEVDPEDGGLIGFVDCPGDEKDLNTPAGKVGTTIQETSVFLIPEWTDGNGKVWKDALWHVALVDGKSVETNQKNFEKVTDQELALAMSFSMADEQVQPGDQGTNKGSHTVEVGKIRKLLIEKLEIELPKDTNDVNFYDRFLTVLTSLKSKEEEEDLTQQPEGTESPSSPIAMADNKDKVDTEVIIKKAEATEKKANSLVELRTKDKKVELKKRITALQTKGSIGKKTAEDWLVKVEAIAMSLDDFDEEGKYPEFAVEMAVAAIEADGISLTDGEHSDTAPEGSVAGSKPEDMRKQDEPMDKETEEEFFENIGMGSGRR